MPYTINLRFPGTPPEPLLNGLEAEGFCVSSGSACHSKAGSMSHVLTALGIKETDGGGLRVSFGRGNEPADIERFVDTLVALVPRLRSVAQRAS